MVPRHPFGRSRMDWAGGNASGSFPTLLVIIVLSLCAIKGSGVARAQGEGPPVDDIIRVRTDLVAIPVVVMDRQNRRVPGLSREEFAVSDNGRSVNLDYFATGTDRVAVVFAIDASGSARLIAAQQRQTALALFSHFGRGSEVAVMRFAETPEFTSPFSSNSQEALAAFEYTALPGRHTAIFDASGAAVQALAARKASPTERRLVIVLSDGLDTVSAATPSAVIKEAQASGVSFYVIHLPIFTPREGRLAPRPASKGFRELASETGGRYFMVGDAKSALDPHAQYNLQSVFQTIEDDLRGQYVLGYYPDHSGPDAGFHRIEVHLPETSKRLRVKALRDGYILK
jgi:Ca-activated chloride channel family protein